MFYQLTERYQLVGWRKMPTGMLDLTTNKVLFLPRKSFYLMLHMNGQEDIDVDKLDPEQQEMLQNMLHRGAVEMSGSPFPDRNQPIYQYHDHVRIESVHWSVTGKCNYQCRHCMLFTTDNPIKDLSTEECLNLIHQFAECGIREISLTGGEPLVRDDLYELIQACTDKNIRVSDIYTNGALLTTEVIEKILSIGQRPDFQISYDGVGWHDWVRGVEGAQDCAEEAIRTAHAYGLRITAAMCLFQDNVPMIRETVLRLASLGVERIKISPMLAKGAWCEHYSEKTLTHQAFLDTVLEYIPNFLKDGKPCSIDMGGYFNYSKEKDFFTTRLAKNPSSPIPLHPCPSTSSVLYISATGTVLPCMEFVGVPEYESFPNIRNMLLADVLKDSIWLQTTQITMDDVYAKNPQCQQCSEWGIHCGINCRAHAEPGFCGLDTDTCQFLRNGWYQKVQSAVEKAGGTFKLM